MASNVIEIVVKAIDQFSATLDKARGSFATLSNNIRSLTGFSLGAIASLDGVRRSVQLYLDASMNAETIALRFGSAFEHLGKNIGVPKAALVEFSKTVQDTTRFSDESVLQMQAVLMRFPSITGEQFKRAEKIIIDTAAATGEDLASVAQGVGRALEDPASGMRILRTMGVVLDESQRKLIATLMDTGRAAEAQGLILGELEKRYKGFAAEDVNTLSGAFTQLKNKFEELFEDPESLGVITKAFQEISKTISDPNFIAGFRGVTTELGKWLAALADIVGFLPKTLGAVGTFLGEAAARAAGAGEADLTKALTAKVAGLKESIAMRQQDLLSVRGSAGDEARINAEIVALQKKLVLAERGLDIARRETAAQTAQEEATRRAAAALKATSREGGREAEKIKIEPVLTEEEKAKLHKTLLDLQMTKIKISIGWGEQELDKLAEARDKALGISDAMAEVNARLGALRGDKAESVAASIDKQFKDVLKTVYVVSDEIDKATGKHLIVAIPPDPELVKRIEEYKQLQTLDDQRASAMKDESVTMAELAAEEERINNSRNSGAIGEFESMRRLEAARRQAIAQLRQQAAALEEVARKQKAAGAVLPDTAKAMAETARAIEKLESQTDLLAQKIRTDLKDAFTSSFSEFIKGTKSAGEAFKDFLRQIINGFLDLIARNFAEKLFAGFGGKEGGGGFLGSIVGGITSLFGFASGGVVPGYAGGGLVRVGEEGPELVALPGGSQVYNQRQLQFMGGGGGGNVNFAPQYNIAITGAKDDEKMRAELYGFVLRKTEADKREMYDRLNRNGFGRIR